MAEDNDTQHENSDDAPEEGIVDPKKVSVVMQQLELLAWQKNKSSGLNFDNLTEKQTDKLIDLAVQNENNGYNYHTKKLDRDTEVRLKIIEATSSGQRTLRIFFITGVGIVALITILILFYKDQYFSSWISFMMGIGGGLGLSKVPQALVKPPNSKTPNIKEEK